jgi:hypothetical protein
MISRRAVMIAVAGLALCGAGVGGVVAGGLQDSPPQNARPVDPIGDMLRNTPVEGAPAGAPAPAAPVPIVTPPPVPGTEEGRPSVILEDGALEAKVDEKPVVKVDEPDVPSPRQRRRVAIVEAIDKVTADRMRFEVEVGGRPVRFNGALIFTARACEVTAPSEAVNDAIAYLDITLEPKGTAVPTAARQIFRGWMFASTPALSGLQHPVYDAWVVGCRA